jgi:serine/threonine-protein kinase
VRAAARLAAGDVKILDFGLAKHDSGAHASVKTRTGITMGTPAYMSPEQCRALPDIDARADLYAAGIVLFEMLAGTAPFPVRVGVRRHDHADQRAGAAPQSGDGRAEPLEGVILQAMEKRAAARFDTADEMLLAIDRALPMGVVTDYATGSERRPPRRNAPQIANNPTIVAPNDAPGGGVGTAAPETALAPKPVRGSGRLPRVVMGAALALAAVGAIVAARAGHPDDSIAPMVEPALPPPAAPVPAAPGPPVSPVQAVEVARPAGTVPSVHPAVLKQPAAAHASKPRPHAAAGAGGKAKKRRAETDLDSPLNPYAR